MYVGLPDMPVYNFTCLTSPVSTSACLLGQISQIDFNPFLLNRLTRNFAQFHSSGDVDFYTVRMAAAIW